MSIEIDKSGNEAVVAHGSMDELDVFADPWNTLGAVVQVRIGRHWEALQIVLLTLDSDGPDTWTARAERVIA